MTDERREGIMRAVYSALCSAGYADLTMQDIADEAGLSKGALHYHFDTKRDLLIAFLEHLYGLYTDRLAAAEDAAGDDPEERLDALLDAAMYPPEKPAFREFRTAVLEIKAQAPYEPAYRERLAEFDGFLHDRVEAILADGVERGLFDDEVDPDAVASFVVTVINGAHTRGVAVGHPVEEVRETLGDYLDGEYATDREVEAR